MPLPVGGRIELNGVAGIVIDIRLFQFSVLEIGNLADDDQGTVPIIHIATLRAFKHPPADCSPGFIFIGNELPVVKPLKENGDDRRETFPVPYRTTNPPSKCFISRNLLDIPLRFSKNGEMEAQRNIGIKEWGDENPKRGAVGSSL